ncbi:MAG: LamG-like jellyroll fold domain-containing protein [Phycisphaerales bacterium]
MICRNCRIHRNRRVSSVQRHAFGAALLALTTAVSTATAEVHHRYVEIPIGYQTFVDVDEDGVFDYGPSSHPSPWRLDLNGEDWANGFLTTDGANTPTLLPIGSLVGPIREGELSAYYINVMIVFAIDVYGGWGQGNYSMPVGKHLVGIQFLRDGTPHYGWLGIVVASSGFDVPPVVATITEIAWESEPGTPIVAGWGDCNGNGLNDVVEILSGADLPDCNGDLVDDDCQPNEDCNGNGVRDLCELGTPGMPNMSDCNGNLIPDACEIAADPTLDCNSDGVIDSCLGALADCDGDGVNDQCQSIPASEDCNGNGLFDWCEMQNDPSLDCDGDGVIDTCQIAASPALDCDGNGLIDSCEMIATPLRDCNGDGVIDACQPWFVDCNGDGIHDACQGTPFAGDPSCLLIVDGAGVEVPGFGNVIPSLEITIELWQWVQAPGTHATFWTPVTNNACTVHVPYVDGAVHWDFGQLPDGRLSYTPPAPIVGSWQHFAFQASNIGQFMRIYRNGVLEAEKAGADTLGHINQPLVLGGAYMDEFVGGIDELRIWNHVRTAEEIQASMGGSIDPATPGLVGYWRFDEGSGSFAADLAGAHDAEFYGSVLWGAPLSCQPSPDLNGDGIVDGGDLGILLGAWGPVPSGSVADLNADGVVDGADLGALLSQWG